MIRRLAAESGWTRKIRTAGPPPFVPVIAPFGRRWGCRAGTRRGAAG